MYLLRYESYNTPVVLASSAPSTNGLPCSSQMAILPLLMLYSPITEATHLSRSSPLGEKSDLLSFVSSIAPPSHTLTTSFGSCIIEYGWIVVFNYDESTECYSAMTDILSLYLKLAIITY